MADNACNLINERLAVEHTGAEILNSCHAVQGRQAAQKVADNAVPATQRFNEEQLKPGADRAAEGLKTGADRASQGLQDAAGKFSDQAGRQAVVLVLHCSAL